MSNQKKIQTQEEIKYFDRFEVTQIKIHPFSNNRYATGIITLFSSEDINNYKQLFVEFTKEELDTWGDDDTIIFSIVANKLGLTLV